MYWVMGTVNSSLPSPTSRPSFCNCLSPDSHSYFFLAHSPSSSSFIYLFYFPGATTDPNGGKKGLVVSGGLKRDVSLRNVRSKQTRQTKQWRGKSPRGAMTCPRSCQQVSSRTGNKACVSHAPEKSPCSLGCAKVPPWSYSNGQFLPGLRVITWSFTCHVSFCILQPIGSAAKTDE